MAGGDRGDNTARCECGHESTNHGVFPGGRQCTFCDCQTDEERYTAARAASERDLRSTLELSAIAEIGAHGPDGIARPAHADAVMADLGAAITEYGELREAVARGMRTAEGLDRLRSWDEAGPVGRDVWLRRADAVLALPEMRALLDAAAKACGHPCIRCVGSREDPNFDIEAALDGEGA